ncbi:outer membrane lipoprotein-sorting protein [Exilibacterium tricleocarpae]|uniref:Outer membrane lipoprotein-sorting protein n=1 Tax=Exilibacterium tricleocarpae TaxID=2591008 RepID=A0A545TAC4_9GAMM|nr:outer membrane lipoprotein-sorting protein [Exilibacterium tricleocarpae]TQV74155.1 outer membrane lipoprotein-sorting protein [Exilibacterium tricleocarpae]
MYDRIALTALLWLVGAGQAGAVAVQDIVDRANRAAYYQAADGKAKVHMQIVDSRGRERNRHFVILRKDVDDANDGEQKLYVYFHSPADVNKTVFMVWKYVDRDDDRWMYLPALDLVKRIAASDERTSFMGSHFFYEDVSGRTPAEDSHQLLEETDDYFVLQSTPKEAEKVEFSRYKNWIHKSTFIPVKTEFYDSAGKVYRTYEALRVEVIEGFATVTQSKMSDTRIGGYTTLSYSNVDYNLDIPEAIFSERYLRSAPRKYLR